MLKGCKHYASKVMKYEDGGAVVTPGKPYIRGNTEMEKKATLHKVFISGADMASDALDKRDSDKFSKGSKVMDAAIKARSEVKEDN